MSYLTNLAAAAQAQGINLVVRGPNHGEINGLPRHLAPFESTVIVEATFGRRNPNIGVTLLIVGDDAQQVANNLIIPCLNGYVEAFGHPPDEEHNAHAEEVPTRRKLLIKKTVELDHADNNEVVNEQAAIAWHLERLNYMVDFVNNNL